MTDQPSDSANRRDERVWRRLRLRRHDGQIYLERWGIQFKNLGGVLLHRMDAPDPGLDLHDHPWWFASIVLRGSYTEERAPARLVGDVDFWKARHRKRFSIAVTRLDQVHRIVALHETPTWTLVVTGPVRRTWGFYVGGQWIHYKIYDKTVRAGRRDLWNEA